MVGNVEQKEMERGVGGVRLRERERGGVVGCCGPDISHRMSEIRGRERRGRGLYECWEVVTNYSVKLRLELQNVTVPCVF